MTAYETVFESFRGKISDYDLALLDDDKEIDVLLGLLNNAIARFGRICSKLQNRDDTLQCFTDDLTFEEINILSEFMIFYWTKPKLYNSDLLKNILSTKDFNAFSSANLLNQIKDINKLSEQQAKTLMNEYSILNSDLENWR